MAKEISREAPASGVVSVCQDQASALKTIRLMHGFPPSADRQVTLANWRQAPFSRWVFHHVGELVPSTEIVNDPADVLEWPLALNDLIFRLSPGHRLAAVGLWSRSRDTLVWRSPQFLRADVMRVWPARNTLVQNRSITVTDRSTNTPVKGPAQPITTGGGHCNRRCWYWRSAAMLSICTMYYLG
jgi:hypothetical protein